MTKVFLGGTCNESTWRERLIEKLTIDYFNPVVDDWNDEARKNELYERDNCDFCLYVITPLMSGYYSIAEVVDDSNKRPDKTILCILDEDYKWECGHPYTWCGKRPYSFNAIEDMVKRNGAKVCPNLEEVAKYLNKH